MQRCLMSLQTSCPCGHESVARERQMDISVDGTFRFMGARHGGETHVRGIGGSTRTARGRAGAQNPSRSARADGRNRPLGIASGGASSVRGRSTRGQPLRG
eukprot:7162496-Prymnesium_polylepis.3